MYNSVSIRQVYSSVLSYDSVFASLKETQRITRPTFSHFSGPSAFKLLSERCMCRQSRHALVYYRPRMLKGNRESNIRMICIIIRTILAHLRRASCVKLAVLVVWMWFSHRLLSGTSCSQVLLDLDMTLWALTIKVMTRSYASVSATCHCYHGALDLEPYSGCWNEQDVA